MLKKFFAKISIAALAFTSLIPQVAFADFTDVPSSHPNSEAILFLQDNGIINGYSDGTFRPDVQVNRVEFLKIILEGSNIPLDVTADTPFPDIDHNQWYGPYVRKAYNAGWVVGYPDGTFKPTQTINKAEALKILGEVQQWNLPDFVSDTHFEDVFRSVWYAPYVSFAFEQGFLAETGPNFEAGKDMTRANISEVIFRTLRNETPLPEEDTTEDEPTPEEEPEKEEPQNEEPEPEPEPEAEEEPEEPEVTVNLDFTPETPALVSTGFFDNVTLDEALPNTFYAGEVYTIAGTIDSGNFDHVTIILDGKTNSDIDENFREKLSGSRFSVPVHFTEAGNYNLGVLPGQSGQSKATRISVLPELPQITPSQPAPSAISSTSISYRDDVTSVNFSAPDSSIKRVTFTQNGKEVTYYSRQDVSSIPVNYADFGDFEERLAAVTVDIALLEESHPLDIATSFIESNESVVFQATEHTFDTIEEDKISATIPDILSSPNTISFSGTVQTDTKTKAFVIRPDGLVDEFELSTSTPTSTYFGQKIIPSGGNFTFTYSPSGTGRYIIEINDKEGLATVNHPIYIGNIIPLVPDYFDLHNREFFTGNLNIQSARDELLNLINQARAEHGFSSVKMADDLNQLAQDHSEDMADNGYFSHFNLQGETPEDRRIADGIITSVSENIAQDTSVIFAHLGLMRSAAHRQNILTPEWERVGLGISLNTEGYILVAEEFSTEPINSQDISDFKDELLTEINDLRTENNEDILIYSSALESASQYLLDKEIQENQPLTNTLFGEALNANNVSGASKAIGRTFNIWSNILQSILSEEQDTILDDWTSVGIDIQTDAEGILHALFIVNSQN